MACAAGFSGPTGIQSESDPGFRRPERGDSSQWGERSADGGNENG